MKQKRVFIHWTAHDSRSASLARHLGTDAFFVQSIKWRSKLLAPTRYFINALRTVQRLCRENPDVIFVANPPIFAVLVVWVYSFFYRCGFIVDTHSAAFTAKRWSIFLWLYRLLAKRAILHILHNEVLEHEVARWGVRTTNFGEVLYQIETDEAPFPFRRGFNVVFVSLFSRDEPLEDVIEAAREMPGINIYVTGSLAMAPQRVIQKASENVIFTDFLSNEKYGALLRGSDVVMCLSKNDNTMQNGAYEALVVGRPIITSDWPVLRSFYHKGAMCIDNSSVSIMSAIRHIQAEYPRYLQEIGELKAEFEATWQKKFSALLELLGHQMPGS
jgi:glycosyltransferase involved in cell wall biosynthesis